MPRQRLFIVAVGLCLVLLGACSSAARPAPVVPTTVAVTTGPHDGAWTGKGVTANGIPLTIAFTVTSDAISSFTYTYPAQDGTTCNGIDHFRIPNDARPK